MVTLLRLAALGLTLHRHFFVEAQIYTFDKTPVPNNRSLQTLYVFYTYAEQDAPDRSMGPPFVKFSGFVAEANNPNAQASVDFDLSEYRGIQVSLLRYRDFWTLIKPTKFCASQSDVQDGAAQHPGTLLVMKEKTQKFRDVNMYVHTARFADKEHGHSREAEQRNTMTMTGTYILAISNCGDFPDATLSGSVIVKNSYGFLPGIEYHKMPFYGWLFIVYIVLAAGWLALAVKWWRELLSIQMCIAAVIFLGLVESFLWYIFFNDWNNTGKRGNIVFILAIWFTVMKSCFSYMLVLVGSLGWGVTRPFLDSQVIYRLQVISAAYIILDFIREVMSSFRHTHSLSVVFVVLCLLPVSLINGGIFYWVFSALSNLITTLKERQQTEKLALFESLSRILIMTLSVATLAMIYQFFDISRDSWARWRYQWFFVDGIPHILFLFVLTAMMYLWAPHKNSQKYAYTQAAGDKEDMEDGEKKTAGDAEKTAGVWADVDGPEEGEDGEATESFWQATQNKNKAGGELTETIGKDAPGKSDLI